MFAAPLTIISSCEIFHQYLLIYRIRAERCNNDNGTFTHSTDNFLYFVVPKFVSHYQLHFSDGLRSLAALREIVVVLCIYTRSEIVSVLRVQK